MMITGARQGRNLGLRRLAARAMARDLHGVIIPGPEVARAFGLDIEAAGIRIAATPRHASVLVLIGELPPQLGDAAAVMYAQMVRPRTILALGEQVPSSLPQADVSAGLSQPELTAAVVQLRRALAEGAFATSVADFDAPVLHATTEYVCPMHPEVVEDQSGSCPKCGMDLVAREAGGKDNAAGGASDYGSHEYHEHGDHSAPDHSHGHGDHEDSGHDHGDMGFMSMVEATKDLPRSRDGLPMDWIEVPFGPFFPGLPGGLRLTLTLDGDGVAEGTAQSLVGMVNGSLEQAADASVFVEQLARAMPLAPASYRLLACRAIEQAAGLEQDADAASAGINALERERVASHLGWLVQLGRQIGMDWLVRRATAMQLGVLRADHGQLVALRPGVQSLTHRLERTPLLKARLADIGFLMAGSELRGPVARAAGNAKDARLVDETYRALGFEICVAETGDAWARLRLRLAEIATSIDLIEAAGTAELPLPRDIGNASGMGEAVIETPRGPATLQLTLESGKVVAVQLDTPCSHHIGLVADLVEQQELGDALVAVGSLDLSPWEVVS